MPPADQVRDALERILASEVFARSERARDLLRYIVDQDLAGHADRLKGFSIGVDVFGKDDRFDPATDTVVRVQAGRLRDLLDQYYAGEGAGDTLRIAVPRGSYVPDYRLAEAASPSPAGGGKAKPVAPAPAPRQDGMEAPPGYAALLARQLRFVAAGLVLALLLIGAVAWQSFAPPQSEADESVAAAGMAAPFELMEATGSVAQDMLPSVFIRVEEGDYGGERVAAALRRGLAAFDTVHFIARSSVSGMQGLPRRTEFLFMLEGGGVPGEVHIELQNVVSGRVLLSRNLQTAARDQAAIDDDVAEMLTSIAPVSGVIYADLAESGAETLLVRCLALNDRFYRNQSGAAHREAYECLEELTAADMKSALLYSELASLHIQSIVNRYDYPPQPSMQQALDFARLAVQLAPNSPYAHRSMGYVLSRTTSPTEALRWTRRAYELNLFDLGMAASYGYALIFAGDYAEGTPILQRAVKVASAHPTWWDYGLFLGHFMSGDMAAASNAVSALASSRRAHYIAARLIAAHELGQTAEAARLLAELQNGHSVFSTDPEAFFRNGNYPEDMTVRLVAALRGAGLIGAS